MAISHVDAEGCLIEKDLKWNKGTHVSSAVLSTDVPANAEDIAVRIAFVINPSCHHIHHRQGGRSWNEYCAVHPQDASRPVMHWPSEAGDASKATLTDAVRRVVETDGVLLTDDAHLDAAIKAMSYVVTQTDDPHAPGGIYAGYVLVDRVFKEARIRGVQHGKEKIGKALADVLSPAVVKRTEDEFSARIEAETLTDKKTSKFFTLESPIVIGDEFAPMVAREFRRIAYTGTMSTSRQIVRPAHEVALGIWLARLKV